MQGIVIAGTHSGSGKTTITLGILAALRKKNYEVQPFKAGPDFIDTGLHSLITGRRSRNLDLWMCGRDYVIDCFAGHSADSDIAVVEGVMGMYDGNLSTADLATALGLPVVLVVDAYGMAESAGAIVKGFTEYDRRGMARHAPTLAGVIFNRVASERHYKRLKDSVRDVPVLGYLPRNPGFEIPHRHLGLLVAEENPMGPEGIDKLADAVLEYVDVEALVQNTEHRTQNTDKCKGKESPGSKIQSTEHRTQNTDKCKCKGKGKESPGSKIQSTEHRTQNTDKCKDKCKGKESPDSKIQSTGHRAQNTDKSKDSLGSVFCVLCSEIKIAVAYDRAFCFYYEDNFDLLREAGAEIVTFSPLSDSKIPDNADALYIGGGYPELYAKELSGNKSMSESVRNFSDIGMPVYAECGGFMYITEGIYDLDNVFYPMAGVFPFKTKMTKGRAGLGYREAVLKEDFIFAEKGSAIRGHEFHYSEIVDRTQNTEHRTQIMYSVKNGEGNYLYDEGYRVRNTLGSYIHIHFGSNPSIAGNFVDFVKEHDGKDHSCRTRQSQRRDK